MKLSEIEKKFTKKVARYISKGYMINSTSMRGSEGEWSKVDFRIEDDMILRVILITEYHNGHRYMALKVGKAKPDYDGGIWNKSLEIIDCQRWHMYARTYVSPTDAWYMDEEEYEAAVTINRKRWVAKERVYAIPRQYTSEAAREVGLRYLKKQWGFKTKKLTIDNVQVCKEDGEWWVKYTPDGNEVKAVYRLK